MNQRNNHLSDKKLTIILSVAVIIIAVVAAVVITLLRTSANREKAIYDYLDNSIKALTVEGDGNDLGSIISNEMLQKAEYKVLFLTEESCTLEVTAPDFHSIVFSLLAKYESDNPDEYEKLTINFMNDILDAMQHGSYSTRVVQITLPVVDGKPVITDEFVDAIYGGLLTVKDEIIEKYIEG